MPDAATYPLLRAARPRRSRLRGPIGLPRLVALAVLATALAVAGHALLRPHRVDDPRRAYADGETAFARGNYSAARNHALAAIVSSPNSAAAHLLLARAYLELGDGLAADAEVTRAHDVGVPSARLAAMRARARFLEADYEGAVDEAGKAAAGDALAIRTAARAQAMAGGAGIATASLVALLARRPRDAAAWIDLGRVRLGAGVVADAADAAGHALALAPRDPAALTLQGEIVRTRFGLTAALPWFEAALARDAYYPPALIEYAATLGEAGRYADMLAATRKALAARPGSPQALFLQATLAARAGKTELARDILQSAGGQLDGLPAAMLLGGALSYAEGKDEQAIGSWRRLVAAQPLNIMARRLLGAALLRSGDAPGALDTLKPIALRPDADRYTLALVARGFEATGDRGSAARFLDRAAAAGGGGSPAFATDDALATLIADAARNGGDPTYDVAVIRGLLDEGDTAGAITRARGLVAAGAGAPAAQLALGDALAAAGRMPEAIDAYRHAANLAFDEPTMLRLVDAAGRIGRTRDAAATLALYLQQNPQSLAGQRLLGHWQAANGAGDAAIETLEGVRRMVGNRDAGLLADLAIAYATGGDAPIARRYARAAYALAPMNAAVADAYGVALAADADVDGARQLFAKAAVLDPGNSAIAAHLRQIGR